MVVSGSFGQKLSNKEDIEVAISSFTLRAGVLLHGLFSAETEQENIFIAADPRSIKLMETLDLINRQHGRQTLKPAVAGLHKNWLPSSTLKSAEYTTCWQDLLKVS